MSDEEIALLPPTAITTSDIDTLRDEGLNVSRRLAAADKLVTHSNYIGFNHILNLSPYSPSLIRIMEQAANSVASFASRNIRKRFRKEYG